MPERTPFITPSVCQGCQGVSSSNNWEQQAVHSPVPSATAPAEPLIATFPHTTLKTTNPSARCVWMTPEVSLGDWEEEKFSSLALILLKQEVASGSRSEHVRSYHSLKYFRTQIPRGIILQMCARENRFTTQKGKSPACWPPTLTSGLRMGRLPLTWLIPHLMAPLITGCSIQAPQKLVFQNKICPDTWQITVALAAELSAPP